MIRRLRIVLGVTIFVVSISLLVWGLMPPEREIRTQPISPSDLQLLPTPISLLVDPFDFAHRSCHEHVGARWQDKPVAVS